MVAKKKQEINWKRLIISIIIAQSAGIIGSLFTSSAIPTWYATLNQPPITPPNWFFAPIWITLYTLIGISFYLIWQKGLNKYKLATVLFSIQLFLNALWSIIFFGMQELLFGLIEIVFLWYFILATIIEFKEIDKRAAYMLFPYIAWVTLATLLNFSFVWLN